MKRMKLLHLLPKITLSSLMVFVLILALGLAALRSSSQTWMLVMSWLTMLILLSSIVGSCLFDGRDRASWLGFAIIGWGHCLLAHSSLFGDDYSIPLKHALEQAGDWMFPRDMIVGEFADQGPRVMNFVRIGRWLLSLLYASLGGVIGCVFASIKDGRGDPSL